MINYMQRWRNLSIKCDRTIEERKAVELMIKNMDTWLQPFLRIAKIHTYQELVDTLSNLGNVPPVGWSQGQNLRYNTNNSNNRGGRSKTKVAFALKDKTKEVANTNTPDNLTISGNINSNSKPRSKQDDSLFDRMLKPYSFRKDKVAKIFKDAMKVGLILPECKRSDEANKSDDLNFCPYHRVLGHPIEDCWVFKDWVEKRVQNGQIKLPISVLQKQAPHASEQVNQIWLETDDRQLRTMAHHNNLESFSESEDRTQYNRYEQTKESCHMLFCEGEEEEEISLLEGLNNRINNDMSRKEIITRLEAKVALQEEMLVKQDDKIRKLKKQKRKLVSACKELQVVLQSALEELLVEDSESADERSDVVTSYERNRAKLASTRDDESKKTERKTTRKEKGKVIVTDVSTSSSKAQKMLSERLKQPYSFRKDQVATIFKKLIKSGLELPECKRPNDMKMSDDPNYCPYHRVVGHKIENCYMQFTTNYPSASFLLEIMVLIAKWVLW